MVTETTQSWSVLLDLGTDVRATEMDALCLEALLNQAGMTSIFYPWRPASDVLTPVGAWRPLQLLVRPQDLADATELAQSILEGRAPHHDVVIPIADAWVLEYWISVVVRHLRHRAAERGGLWNGLWFAYKAYILIAMAAFFLFGSISAVQIFVATMAGN